MFEREKIKIRVNENVYKTLIKDMEAMNFYKPGGSLNKNKFFIKLINSIYQDYLATNEHIKTILLNEFPEKDENELMEVTTKINQYNITKRQSDKLADFHTKDIYIQITKESRALFNEIELTALRDITLSEFLRCLIHEYIMLPPFEKERCILFDLHSNIEQIIDDEVECVIKTKDDQLLKFQIADMYINKDETHRMIKGFIVKDGRKELIDIRLVDIDYVTALNTTYDFTDDEIKLIEDSEE